MTSTEIKKLLKLDDNEKIKLVQTLWNSIAERNEDIELPKEHIHLIEQRLNLIRNGKVKFKNWNSLKKKYISSLESKS